MRKRLVPTFGVTTKLAVMAIMLAVYGHADSGNVSAATVTVDVGDFWFCNSSFSGGVCPTSIKTGDTVTWNWVGSAPHTSTACSDANFSTCGAAQGWDSGSKTSGTFSRTFNTAGTFFYRCQIHPTTMRGRIEVVQDSDGDSWSDAAESIIGTDPLRKCGVNAWPPDINNDGFSDISDIVALGASFGKSVPPAPARYNIAPDGRLRGHYRHRSVGVAFREELRRHLRTRSEISPDQALRRTAGKGCWIKAVSRPTLSA